MPLAKLDIFCLPQHRAETLGALGDLALSLRARRSSRIVINCQKPLVFALPCMTVCGVNDQHVDRYVAGQ